MPNHKRKRTKSNQARDETGMSGEHGSLAGKNIRRIRMERGFSAKEFAEKVGTSPPQITRLEKGHRRLTDIWLDRIASALDLTVNDILVEQVLNETVPVTYVAGAQGDDSIPKQDRAHFKFPLDDRYPNVSRYGVLIGKNHAGGQFEQGSIVICAPLDAMNEPMAVGTAYHVRHSGDGGFLSLICTLEQDPSGGLWLPPDTKNPSLTRAIPYEGTTDASVVLTGRVIGHYATI